MQQKTDDSKPTLFYHVGMGKTASTYLREKFFPKLEGAYFIPRNQKYNAVQLLNKAKYSKYILCRAFDTNLEDGIQEIAAAYPNTRPIIIFRKQDKWIASQYRRFVKNGFPGSLKDFIDVVDDKGYWKREELLFMGKIKLLEQYFEPRPLVLFHEELKENPKQFFDKIADYTSCTYNFEDISLNPKHISYSKKGLLFRRRVRRLFSNKPMQNIKVPGLHWIHRKGSMLGAYFLIWIGNLIPAKWLTKEPLINPEYLKKVNEFTSNDWEALKIYAKNNEE